MYLSTIFGVPGVMEPSNIPQLAIRIMKQIKHKGNGNKVPHRFGKFCNKGFDIKLIRTAEPAT